MRYFFAIIFFAFVFSACKKDKFTTAPQIKFLKFKPDNGNSLATSPEPYLIIELTDSEGDFDTDSAKIFMRNTFTNKIDSSLRFPDIGTSAGKDFKAEVELGLKRIMDGRTPGGILQPPYVDTIGFEVYVTDRAKNKSNVITAAPFYYYRL